MIEQTGLGSEEYDYLILTVRDDVRVRTAVTASPQIPTAISFDAFLHTCHI